MKFMIQSYTKCNNPLRQNKKKGKDQESKQSITTPDPGGVINEQ